MRCRGDIRRYRGDGGGCGCDLHAQDGGRVADLARPVGEASALDARGVAHLVRFRARARVRARVRVRP